MTSTQLNSEIRDQGLRAMTVLALAKDPSTASLASTKALTVADDVDSVESVLLEALSADPQGWAAWLQNPAHSNAAASMTVALSEEALSVLAHDDNATELVEVLLAKVAERATTRSIAHDLAKAEEVIDLTDRKSEVSSRN